MAFHDAKDPLRPDRGSDGPEVVSPGAPANRTSDTSVVDRRFVILLTENRRAFLSTETAGTALSVKKSDREDDPRCLPSIGARASERGCDAAPFFFGGDLAPNLAIRRYRCASFDPHLRSRRGDVTSVARSSVACRGERRAHTLRCVSGLSPSAEPPPTPNRSPPSRTAPDPMFLWATTALPISAATFDARARTRAVVPLPREAVASVRVPLPRCRLHVRLDPGPSRLPCG